MRAAPRTDPDMRNCLIRLLPRVDAEALLPLVPASVRLTSLILSLCTGLVGLKQVPLGQVPSLHHLRRSMVTPCVIEEPLFDGFPGTMGLSDCSAAFILELRPPAFSSRAGDGHPASHCRALPVPVHGACAHAAGLWLRGVKTGTREIAPASCCLPHRWTRSALPRGDFGDQYCACAPLC